MANFLRTIILRSSYGGVTGGGILQSSVGSQKLFSFVPNLLLNSLIKCCSVNSPQELANFRDFKQKLKYDYKRISKLDQINLNVINYSGLKEGAIVNTFQRLCKVYEKNKNNPVFKNEVNQFIHSKDFIKFCKTLEQKLPTLSPGSLLALLDLENFQVQAISSLIVNLFNLILDNFNKLTLFEVVYLYARFSQSQFKDSVHWKNIKKACEVYFKERFDLDLLNCNFSAELLTIIELEALPEAVRKSVARKLMNDAYLNTCNQKEMTSLIHTICNNDHTLVPKDELLRLIRKCSYTFHSHSLVVNLSASYTALLQKDESFYDEEVISLLLNAGFKKLVSASTKVKFIYNMCLVGYYDKEFVSFVCNFLQSRSSRSIYGDLALKIATILAGYSAHETESEEDMKLVRKLLMAVDHSVKQISFPELCTWCECLTYLGCDTRNLVSEIFTTVMESPSPASEKNILTLHHLAKAYLSNGYQTLPQELLKVLLADEFKQVQPFSLDSLTPYFGSEDYVLKNCTTSDSHCLHFVSLFGADNKPISLSEYKEKQLNLPLSEFLKIEDIQRPPESKMVVFQIFPEDGPVKFLNEPGLSGVAKMNLKMFENLDCSIIFLPWNFFKLTPEAREEFLRTQINEVIGNLEMSQSTALEQ